MQILVETAKHAVIQFFQILTPNQWFVQLMSDDNRDSTRDDDKCSNHTSPQHSLTSSAFKSFIHTCGFLFMAYLFNKVCSLRKLCSKLKSNRHYLASGDSSFIMDNSEGGTSSYGFETGVLKQNIERNELGVLGISLNGDRKDDQENLNSESVQSSLDYMFKRWTCKEKQDNFSSQSVKVSALPADPDCDLNHFLISEYNSMQKRMNELQKESDSLRKMIRKMTTEKEEEMSYSKLEMMEKMNGIIEGLAWEKDTLERFLKMKHEEVELEQEKCAEVIAFTKQLVPVELAPFVEDRLLDIRRCADPNYVPEGHTASMVSAGSGDSVRNYILFWMVVPERL